VEVEELEDELVHRGGGEAGAVVLELGFDLLDAW
jgi:hypothetical protein